tara:strand:+ start:86 stop:631 length:546 start_codon:yes stop_codon:yes gene_type:complete
MKFSKQQLKNIIQEEIRKAIDEQNVDCHKYWTAHCKKVVAAKTNPNHPSGKKDDFGDPVLNPNYDMKCAKDEKACFQRCFEPKLTKCLKAQEEKYKKEQEQDAARERARAEAEKSKAKEKKKTPTPKEPKAEKRPSQKEEYHCRSTSYCKKVFGKKYYCDMEFKEKIKGKFYGSCSRAMEF